MRGRRGWAGGALQCRTFKIGVVVDWDLHISFDPAVCHGKACVRGTRVLVSVVLDNLAEGLDAEEIVRSYPSLTAEDVRATLAYAAEIARDPVLALPR